MFTVKFVKVHSDGKRVDTLVETEKFVHVGNEVITDGNVSHTDWDHCYVMNSAGKTVSSISK